MIVTSTEFYRKAFLEDYALGGFQAYNMEMVQGIVEACSAERSPAIVQSSCRGVRYAGAETLFQIARIASEKADIPVVLHLDHGDGIELCKQAIDAGFSSVMLDNTDMPLEEQAERTKVVADYAHDHGAVLEGEIALRGDFPEVWRTSVESAVAFCNYTGCDSLSVCVGNSHALYGRGFPEGMTPHLHLKLLADIHDALPQMPLVLHSINCCQQPDLIDRFNQTGGKRIRHNGFLLEELHLAFQLGVVKCNVGVDKTSMTVGIREYLSDHPEAEDPRKYLGNGKSVMKSAIRQQMQVLFMSSNKL